MGSKLSIFLEIKGFVDLISKTWSGYIFVDLFYEFCLFVAFCNIIGLDCWVLEQTFWQDVIQTVLLCFFKKSLYVRGCLTSLMSYYVSSTFTILLSYSNLSLIVPLRLSDFLFINL
jgi:hypothetical protein